MMALSWPEEMSVVMALMFFFWQHCVQGCKVQGSPQRRERGEEWGDCAVVVQDSGGREGGGGVGGEGEGEEYVGNVTEINHQDSFGL
jgi:hypothetical protein